MKIKRKRRHSNIEEYRSKLLCAVDAMNPDNKLILNREDGTVNINGVNSYPSEVIYYRDIELLIDKRNFYLSMSSDAKTIVGFICFSKNAILVKLCGSPTRGIVSATRIAKYFKTKWGQKRVSMAMGEIRKLLKI